MESPQILRGGLLMGESTRKSGRHVILEKDEEKSGIRLIYLIAQLVTNYGRILPRSILENPFEILHLMTD